MKEYKTNRKFSQEEKDKMRKLRDEEGLSYQKIANHFGASTSGIQYCIDEKYREKALKRASEYQKDGRYVERRKVTNKLWRKNNPNKNRRTVCLSMLRRCLKEGSITREEIEEIMWKQTMKAKQHCYAAATINTTGM